MWYSLTQKTGAPSKNSKTPYPDTLNQSARHWHIDRSGIPNLARVTAAQTTTHLTPHPMTRSIYLVTLGIAACLASCSTSGPRLVSTSVHEGMTSAQLVSAFGKPLRVEHHPDGGEDWFYNFGSQQHAAHPVSELKITETERSYSVGDATSTTTTMSQAPVHLSPSGRVVGAIPSGSVVVE